MKGYQPSRQDQSRPSNLAIRKSKESNSKKVVKKNLNTEFTSVDEDLLPEIFEEPTDFSPISEILDADESFALDSLEPFDLSLISAIKISKNESDLSSGDYRWERSNGSKIISLEAEVVVNLLKQARIQVSNSIDTDARSKRLLDALVKIIVDELYAVPEEEDCFTELFTMKTRIVYLSLICIIAVSVILFLNSGSGRSFIGPPPT